MKVGVTKIGKNSYFNKSSLLYEKAGKTITIGDNVAIGHWCYMSTRMHATSNHQEKIVGDIVIEDDVWIGNSVVVYPGVTIGKGSVIGAGCVITKDVPPNTVVKVVMERYMK